MVSFKRFLYIILIIVGLGGIFLIYNVHESRPASAHSLTAPDLEREFMPARRVDGGDTPRVWLLGDPEDARCGAIYENVRQICRDLQLTVAGEGRLDAEKAEQGDLVIFCDDRVSRWADPDELEDLIAGGGRAILAAGLAEGQEDPSCGRRWASGSSPRVMISTIYASKSPCFPSSRRRPGTTGTAAPPG